MFVSNIEKGGRGSNLSEGERGKFTRREKVGNFHVSQQILSMIEAMHAHNNYFIMYV